MRPIRAHIRASVITPKVIATALAAGLLLYPTDDQEGTTIKVGTTEPPTSLDPAGGYPRSTLPDGRWRTVPRHDWTSGFFPGTLWLLHEHTRDPALRAEAERWTRPLAAITRAQAHGLQARLGEAVRSAAETAQVHL